MKNYLKKRKKIIIFIALSLIIHMGLFWIPLTKYEKRGPEPLIVERIIMDDLKKQIVDATPPKDESEPQDSRFLSKQNSKAEEETKAQNVGKTINSQPSTQVLNKPTPKKSLVEDKKLSMADLGLKMKTQPQRSPSTYAPPAQTDDYLPDVKSGLETSLNTREFKFYSYFERIKDRLRMYWEPELQSRIQKVFAQGSDLNEHDLITKLHVTLSKNGELSKVVIEKNSGYEEVDSAAVVAFEKAAPFPNPPSGMIEDGVVHLTWSFVVQTRGMNNIFVFLSKR